MTNEQILQKVIEKAKENGFNTFKYYVDGCFHNWFSNGEGRYNQELTIIFSHDFAKCFWGEEETYNGTSGQCDNYLPAWKFYLQQMVLEEEPIKYLEKFL